MKIQEIIKTLQKGVTPSSTPVVEDSIVNGITIKTSGYATANGIVSYNHIKKALKAEDVFVSYGNENEIRAVDGYFNIVVNDTLQAGIQDHYKYLYLAHILAGDITIENLKTTKFINGHILTTPDYIARDAYLMDGHNSLALWNIIVADGKVASRDYIIEAYGIELLRDEAIIKKG